MNPVCSMNDLIENAGICALYKGEQVAIFYLPDQEQKIFGLSNRDPFSEANIISRGIVGSLEGQAVVASPIYKQHFLLDSGQCLEDENVQLKTFNVALLDDQVVINA